MKKLIIPITAVALAPLAHSANLALLTDGGATFTRLNTDIGLTSRTDTPISGLGAGEVLTGIDFRPATGVTYGISSASNIYTINTTTAAATQLGGTLSPALNGSAFGFDYNPAFMNGRFARSISDQNNNVVVDGNLGGYLGGPKTDVFYAAGDANDGATPTITHIAYTNSIPGPASTQQYGIDSGLNILTTVANNAGTLETVGPLGVDASDLGGFDIDGTEGIAYAAFQNATGTASTLYTIDLGSGTATQALTFAGGVQGLTSIPEPSSALLLSLAGLGLIGRRKR